MSVMYKNSKIHVQNWSVQCSTCQCSANAGTVVRYPASKVGKSYLIKPKWRATASCRPSGMLFFISRTQNREQKEDEKEVQMWVNRYVQRWRGRNRYCVCTGANLGNLGAVLAGSRSVRNSQRQAVHSPTQSVGSPSSVVLGESSVRSGSMREMWRRKR